jgi:hypothetical protein
MSECASYAIKHERWGFWGGLGPRERQRIRETLGISLYEAFDSEKYDEYIIMQRVIDESLVEEEAWI